VYWIFRDRYLEAGGGRIASSTRCVPGTAFREAIADWARRDDHAG
jgi:hypothetical protein